jgi:hypothetical protein
MNVFITMKGFENCFIFLEMKFRGKVTPYNLVYVNEWT